VGPGEGDRLYAEAIRRAARKFGLRVVADKPWTHDPGAQRTDTGHVSIAAEAARFTQGAPSHDVLWWPTRRASGATASLGAPRTRAPWPAPTA
jgi:hypothetical protein